MKTKGATYQLSQGVFHYHFCTEANPVGFLWSAARFFFYYTCYTRFERIWSLLVAWSSLLDTDHPLEDHPTISHGFALNQALQPDKDHDTGRHHTVPRCSSCEFFAVARVSLLQTLDKKDCQGEPILIRLIRPPDPPVIRSHQQLDNAGDPSLVVRGPLLRYIWCLYTVPDQLVIRVDQMVHFLARHCPFPTPFLFFLVSNVNKRISNSTGCRQGIHY